MKGRLAGLEAELAGVKVGGQGHGCMTWGWVGGVTERWG